MKFFHRVFHNRVEKNVKNPVFPYHHLWKSLLKELKTYVNKPLSGNVETLPDSVYNL